MIEFSKNGIATHVIQRLDLTGHVRSKGHKWKDVAHVRVLDVEVTEMVDFILLHKLATGREIKRNKIRVTTI